MKIPDWMEPLLAARYPPYTPANARLLQRTLLPLPLSFSRVRPPPLRVSLPVSLSDRLLFAAAGPVEEGVRQVVDLEEGRAVGGRAAARRHDDRAHRQVSGRRLAVTFAEWEGETKRRNTTTAHDLRIRCSSAIRSANTPSIQVEPKEDPPSGRKEDGAGREAEVLERGAEVAGREGLVWEAGREGDGSVVEREGLGGHELAHGLECRARGEGLDERLAARRQADL